MSLLTTDKKEGESTREYVNRLADRSLVDSIKENPLLGVSEKLGAKLDQAMDKMGVINLDLEADEPPEFSVKLNDLVARDKYLARVQEKGLINEKTGSSVTVRDNGQVNLSASLYSQYKLNPNGKIYEQSLESETKTNRKVINANDIVINGHKMNPALWELTNFKQVNLPYTENVIIGDFTMKGSVLVKAWEPNLKRYMLIRRPCRMKPFGELLNVPEINTGIDILDPFKIDEEILALTDKGYQVNALITDSKSRIGKEGENRGTEFGTGTTFVDGSGGASGGGGAFDVTAYACDVTGENVKDIWKFLTSNGYTKEAAAGIMGNMMRESHCDPTCMEGYYLEQFDKKALDGSHEAMDAWTRRYWEIYGPGLDHGAYEGGDGHLYPGIGLCQWTGPRAKTLFEFAAGKGKKWTDLGCQLSMFASEMDKDVRGPVKAAVNQSGMTPEQCAEKFGYDFEGNVGASISERKAFARQIYDEWANKK